MGLLGMHDEETIGHEKVDASHAGGYEKSDRVDVVAVADIDEEKLTRFGEVWDVPEADRYPGHEAMLEARDLDVVSVATPTSLHHEHTVAAARSAADPDAIWCEKPIATSVGDAEEMIDVCAETDTELVINHTSRFTHNIQQVRTLIREENLLGDVHSANAMFRMELMRNSTHLLDTLVYLLDTRASEVSGYITGNNEAVDGIGSIEVGKRADTIVRDLDNPEWTSFHRPIQTLVYSANAHNVAHSIVDGELVMEDREVLTMDEAAVKEQARRVTRTGCRCPGAAAPGGGSPASRCTPRRRRRR